MNLPLSLLIITLVIAISSTGMSYGASPDLCWAPDFCSPSPFDSENFTLKEQIQKGWTEKDLTCKDEHVLAFKVMDYSPVCLYPQTKEKLLERGIVQLTMRDRGFEFSTYTVISPVDAVYSIDYSINGATITSILQWRMPYHGIVLEIIPEKAGELFMDIPMDIFENREHDPLKVNFSILNDGQEIKHNIIKNKDLLELSFEFGKYDTRFEIMAIYPEIGVEQIYEEFFREHISESCPITSKPDNAYSYDEKKCKWLTN